MSDPTDAMQADWQRTAILVALEGSMARGVRVMGEIRLGPPYPTPFAAVVKRAQSQCVTHPRRCVPRQQCRQRPAPHPATAAALA